MDKFIPDGIYLSIYLSIYTYIYIYIYVYIYVYIYILHIYSIMKIICPPGCHCNGFLATHELGDMTYIHPFCLCEI